MQITRHGSVSWTGGLRDGRGAISTRSGALDQYPYGFMSRFEGVNGSNPEELLAAAHAACFTMSLMLALERAGLKAKNLKTDAMVTLVGDDAGYYIPKVALTLVAEVPDSDLPTLRDLASHAERNCPVSKLFKADISLEVTLTSS